jgi:hypothetical protein
VGTWEIILEKQAFMTENRSIFFLQSYSNLPCLNIEVLMFELRLRWAGSGNCNGTERISERKNCQSSQTSLVEIVELKC